MKIILWRTNRNLNNTNSILETISPNMGITNATEPGELS